MQYVNQGRSLQQYADIAKSVIYTSAAYEDDLYSRKSDSMSASVRAEMEARTYATVAANSSDDLADVVKARAVEKANVSSDAARMRPSMVGTKYKMTIATDGIAVETMTLMAVAILRKMLSCHSTRPTFSWPRAGVYKISDQVVLLSLALQLALLKIRCF
jgi:hypothetical protein